MTITAKILIVVTFFMAAVVVTHYVMPKLTERGCLIVGGITVCMLTLGASFAPNIEVFIAIFAVKGEILF